MHVGPYRNVTGRHPSGSSGPSVILMSVSTEHFPFSDEAAAARDARYVSCHPCQALRDNKVPNSNVSGTLRVPLLSGGTRSVPDTIPVT